MIKKFISATSHALDPPSPVTNCHTFSDPSPSSVTYFLDGPFNAFQNLKLDTNIIPIAHFSLPECCVSP